MRRRSRFEIGEYDSLTDTVTNVVGVLVIVLGVTRVSLGNRPLALRPQPVPRVIPESLEEELVRVEAQVREIEGTIDALEAEKRQELARLDGMDAGHETEGIGSPAPLPPSVPFPDPARSQEKELVAFYCQSSRIHPFRFEALTDLLNERAKGILGVRHLSELGKHELVAQYCRENFVADEYLRWSVVVTEHGSDRFSARAELTQRSPTVGESLTGLASMASEFRRLLGTMDPDRHWIYFFVWEDSFDVYLAADRLAREAGFATGWLAYAEGETYGTVLTRSKDSSASDEHLKPFPQ